jgi:hypothetical protein
MIDVSSRPESIYEQYASETEQDDTTAQAHNEDKDKDKEVSEMKSIKSVSSMMSKEDSSSGSKLDRDRDRATISNRLASIGVLGRLSSPVGEEGATSPSPTGDASPSKASGLFSFEDRKITDVVAGHWTAGDIGFGSRSRRLTIRRHGHYQE